MIKKNTRINKKEIFFKDYLKIKNKINLQNLNFKIDSEKKLVFLFKSINKFMIQRLECVKHDECLTYFLQNMKRYKVMTSIMESYLINSGSTYKEEIIKKLNIYSYKTISGIIDDSLERGYIKYVGSSPHKKTKKFRPTSTLISNYINWTLQTVGDLNKSLRNVK